MEGWCRCCHESVAGACPTVLLEGSIWVSFLKVVASVGTLSDALLRPRAWVNTTAQAGCLVRLCIVCRPSPCYWCTYWGDSRCIMRAGLLPAYGLHPWVPCSCVAAHCYWLVATRRLSAALLGTHDTVRVAAQACSLW
jgi:hypothetical protein